MNQRLDIRKTYKLYIGGAFVRSESGRSLPAQSVSGKPLDNFCHGSRKDLRDAVVAARNAFEGWAKRTAYLRGQILYRAAEMLQNRASELVNEIVRSAEVSPEAAQAEVNVAIDRLVYYAGWTDKYSQVFGSVNPVSSSHFNFTSPEPSGVVVVVAPNESPLAALVSLIAPAILSGNSCVVIASETFPLVALTFSEILATSDLPGGVVNVIVGKRAEFLPHIASHMDINSVIDASGSAEIATALQSGSALNLKRVTSRTLTPEEWAGSRAEDPYWIMDTVELKTAWHPIGV
ncbi:MAG: Aldehyde Dehydrogenase [Verrucomicrobiales bacterium]|nr:Aldehyde Dehydrogenase [Verrucomicrobiales bacterium]